MVPTDNPGEFAAALTGWFQTSAADYPWRRTTDPYAILVSEIMLQQTQVATVLGKEYYTRWMRQFPDVETLAAASESAILRAWEGLGYYRRARNLQRAARAVAEEHGGKFPRRAAEILALPGVGRYTAGAVASFAYNDPEPIVDANIARVFSRLFNYRDRIDTTHGSKFLWTQAEFLVATAADPRTYNSALMELGQTVCTPRAPACENCPVQDFCTAPDPASLPLKGAPKAIVELDEHVFLIRKNGQILLEQESGGRRVGLWKLPQLPDKSVAANPILTFKYTITHHRVTLRIYPVKNVTATPEQTWHSESSLPDLALGSPYRKALKKLL